MSVDEKMQTLIRQFVQPDPFNAERFRLGQDVEELSVETVLTTVPVRRPGKQDFIQVHSGDDYQLQAAVIDFQEERQIYLVESEILDAVIEHYVPVTLFTAITLQGVLFLWPAKMSKYGRATAWHRSAHAAAQHAMTDWVRVTANVHREAYDVAFAKGNLPQPDWPRCSFNEILKVAFQDRVIDSLDHPVIRRLEGRE